MLLGSRHALNLLYYICIIYTDVMPYYTYTSCISTSPQSIILCIYFIYRCDAILCMCFLVLDKPSTLYIIYMLHIHMRCHIIHVLPGSRQALNLRPYYIYIYNTDVMPYYICASCISTSPQSIILCIC